MVTFLIAESEFTESTILRVNSISRTVLPSNLPAIDNPGDATQAGEDDLKMMI